MHVDSTQMWLIVSFHKRNITYRKGLIVWFEGTPMCTFWCDPKLPRGPIHFLALADLQEGLSQMTPPSHVCPFSYNVYKVDYAVIRIKTSFLATVILGILKSACQHIIFLLLWFGTIVLLSLPCLVWNLIVCRVASAARVYCLPSTPLVTLLVLWG